MNRRATLAAISASLMLAGLAAPAGDAAAQDAKSLVGTYTLVSADTTGLPKFASNNRTKGTPEENQAIVAGSLGHFGKYTVDEKDKAFTFHIEASTYPNWDGTAQKRPFTISGDELRYGTAAASGGGRADLVWKRVK